MTTTDDPAAQRAEIAAPSAFEAYHKSLDGKSADELRAVLAQEWADAEQRHVTDCHDCGLAYGGEGWIECIVPDDIWRLIGPTGDEGGILCITCIARRAKRAGLTRVPVMLCGTEVLRTADTHEAFDRGWGAAKVRMQELEETNAMLEGELQRTSEALGEGPYPSVSTHAAAILTDRDRLAAEQTRMYDILNRVTAVLVPGEKSPHDWRNLPDTASRLAAENAELRRAIEWDDGNTTADAFVSRCRREWEAEELAARTALFSSEAPTT